MSRGCGWSTDSQTDSVTDSRIGTDGWQRTLSRTHPLTRAGGWEWMIANGFTSNKPKTHLAGSIHDEFLVRGPRTASTRAVQPPIRDAGTGWSRPGTRPGKC